MPIARIPDNIHVDPNMHELIYQDLVPFALLFERTSLYAVSGYQLDNYFPLKHDGFISLIEWLDDTPFVLTAPNDFYDQKSRVRRLNQKVMAWHWFDDWVVRHKHGTDGLIQADRSAKMREEAWQRAETYRRVVHSIIENKTQNSNRTVQGLFVNVRDAYVEAKTQFQNDRITLQREKLSHRLPATFYDDISDARYRDMLSSGDVLPLLALEHFTKPQIIRSLNPKFRKAFPGGALQM